DRACWTAPFEVPALSYVTVPAAEVRAADMSGLVAGEGRLSNGRVTLTLDTKAGGVTALEVDGVDYVGKAGDNLRFGVPVLETATAGTRDDIFLLKDIESPDWFAGWNLDWAARRDAP